MDFDFNEEQIMIQKTARDFAIEVIQPLVEEAEKNEKFPMELFTQMGELGFLGIPFPDEYGGIGPAVRVFLVAGVLGGFTTFSAFSLETLRLLDQREFERALLNVSANLMLSLIGAALGIAGLVAAVGLEGFRGGMREHFRRHAYSNATLADFLAAVEHGSGISLAEWARLWLETPSLNTIAAHWTADGDRLSRLWLTQSAPPEYPYLRPHRLDVGLAREEGAGLRIIVLPASISGEEAELHGAAGLPRPNFVFPNYGDHGYCKVALDPESLQYILANIGRVDDTLLRLQLWASLWNMVRDQQLSSLDYLSLVRSAAPAERHPELAETITANALAAISRYVPESRIEDEAHSFFETAKSALESVPAGDLKKIWTRAMIGAAAVPGDVAYLTALADGIAAIPGVELDQEMRWSIAVKAAAYALPGAAERVAAEAQRDPSDRGVRARLRAETSVPDPAAKAAAWEKFLGEGYGSLYLTGAAMSGFNWRHQRAILETYVKRFFEALPGVFRDRDKEFATDFFRHLAPTYRVEPATVELARHVLDTGGTNVLLSRTVREFIDDMERAIRCREFAAGKATG
ncbi:MAG: ERAP1-like C-terminal domain-containing protein [Dehalococcoidia bacterium]|nr:ERAP1-like C-terminal domain-containing protein [Dehalococcoidia bacterium]